MRSLAWLVVVWIATWWCPHTWVTAASTLDVFTQDYACPAVTICPLLCVPYGNACPTAAYNNEDDDNEDDNNDDDDIISHYYETTAGMMPSCPTSSCGEDWTPCPATLDILINCQALYGEYYAAMASLSGSTSCDGYDASSSSSEAPYGVYLAVVWTVWVVSVSAAWVAWQAWRAKKVRQLPPHNAHQQGWCPVPVGRVLVTAVRLTRTGWLVGLVVLAWHYYAADNDAMVNFLHVPSPEAVLRAFIVIWTMGLVWNLLVPNGAALSLLACAPTALATATIVTWNDTTRPPVPDGLIFPTWRARAAAVLRTLSERFHKPAPTVCHVMGQEETRFMTHQLQRYTYQPSSKHAAGGGGCFQPAVWRWHSSSHPTNDTTTSTKADDHTIRLRDFMRAHGGLSTAQVYSRWLAVGNNTMDLPQPNFQTALHRELAQPFYTYQWFMICSWLPLYYFYMACTW